MKKIEPFKDYTKIIIETDEENPIAIAEITSEEINVSDGYRVRLTPKRISFAKRLVHGNRD